MDGLDDLTQGILAREHRARLVSLVDGKPFTAHIDTVKRLKREGCLDEAEALLLRLDRAASAWAEVMNVAKPPWYGEQISIVRRKLAKRRS